jgi:hypothetical protein
LDELAAHGDLPPVIVLVFADALADAQNEMMRGSRRERPPADVPDHVFLLCAHTRVHVDEFEHNNPTLIALFRSVGKAWQADPVDMLAGSLLTRVADGETQPALPKEKVWGDHIHVLRQPGSSRDALASALQGFYEFVAKHPTASRPAQARLMALGELAGEVLRRRRQEPT